MPVFDFSNTTEEKKACECTIQHFSRMKTLQVQNIDSGFR